MFLVWGRQITDSQERRFGRIEQRLGLPPPRHQQALARVVGGLWLLAGIGTLAMMIPE